MIRLVSIEKKKKKNAMCIFPRVSAAHSAMWKSSLMRSASNSITWYRMNSPLASHIEEPFLSHKSVLWMLRDPATANQFQPAFKVKVMTSVATVGATVGTAHDSTSPVESAWSKLKNPLLEAMGTWSLVVEWTGGWRCALSDDDEMKALVEHFSRHLVLRYFISSL